MSSTLQRAVAAAMSAGLLSACAEQKTSSTVFEKASEECAADVIDNHFLVTFSDGRIERVQAESTQAFLDGYLSANLAQIEFAEPDYKVAIKVGANISGDISPEMLAPTLIDNWGAQRVSADALWQQSVRGANVTVAVVDSGADITHPQLRPRLAVNAGETGTDSLGHDRSRNGVDDDGNGLIDDAFGYDFGGDHALVKDNNFHGSHVAGIIAAAHSDTAAGPASHVQGIAPEAKLLPLAFLNSDGTGALSNAVTAIKYAVQRGARVINASWGGTTCSRTLRQVVAGLEAKGVIFVAAAGNDSLDIDRAKEYPASFNLGAQITVGATGQENFMASYSNYGSESVHIFAPGTEIVSTVPGGVGALSGTSMAAPFVSGAAALLLSAEPEATPAQIRQALFKAAVHRGDYLNASQGRMDLREALSALRRYLGR